MSESRCHRTYPSHEAEQAVHARRRAALERAAEHYADVPEDVIDSHVGRVDFGTELLGGDPELTEAAVLALERNLQRYRSALHDSAEPAETGD